MFPAWYNCTDTLGRCFFMVDFNRLDDTPFPHIDTVDPYQFKNTYDFDRFKGAQMRIRLLNVPWDLGSVHVGQKIVTGIGNVVFFETAAKRDAWFDSMRYAANAQEWATGNYDGIEWITDYRRYHSEDEISLPVPFDVLAKFNYLTIDYIPAPTPDAPVDFEGDGIQKWFYFIRSIRMRAVNSTIAEIYGDLWSTYIYDMNITNMVLEQGHAPLSMVDADTYLANPIENTRYLLDEDANFGELQKVVSGNSVVLNAGDMWAAIVTTADPIANWGSAGSNWRVPSGSSYLAHGVPSYYAMACNPADLSGLLAYLDANIPQFKQTVQGVFFVAKDLVNTIGAFSIGEIDCVVLAQKNVTRPLLSLDRAQFGYARKYANIAKLYTYPYAAIEVADEKGNSTIIKIEDTTGTLELDIASNVAFPYLALDGRLSGVGGSAYGNITFRDVTAHSFDFDGRWYEHLRRWDIPVFAITQNAAVDYGFRTYYDRQQQALENTTANANAKRSAQVAYDNALASNATAQTNALASNNGAWTNARNTALAAYNNAKDSNATTNANAKASNATANTNAKNSNTTAYDNALDSNNQSAANALASNATAYNNAVATNAANYNNAVASNLTTKNNAHASNDTAKYNADVSADTLVNNATMQTSTNSTLNVYSNTLLMHRTTLAANEDLEKTGNANFLIDQTTNAQMDSQIQSAAISAVSGIVGNAVQGASAGMVAGLPGAAAGAIGGAAAGLVNAGLSAMQTQVAINLNATMAQENKSMNTATQNATARYNAVTNADGSSGRAGVTIEYNDNSTTANNANITTQTATNASTMKTNATRTQTTANSNADAAQATGDANALRTQTVSDQNALALKNTNDTNATNARNVANANALATKTTADTNADNTKTTADANADLVKTTDDNNAKRTWENAYAVADLNKTIADGNADRAKATGDANALRTYNAANANADAAKATADAAITAGINSAALNAPIEYGSFANGETATTRPMALFANVVTQSDNDIAQAGDNFLRYGYQYRGNWQFDGNFNVMDKFTFWKCSDVWIKGLNMPDEHVDYIRFLLIGGVTVWSDPDYIGNTTIYENGV